MVKSKLIVEFTDVRFLIAGLHGVLDMVCEGFVEGRDNPRGLDWRIER